MAQGRLPLPAPLHQSQLAAGFWGLQSKKGKRRCTSTLCLAHVWLLSAFNDIRREPQLTTLAQQPRTVLWRAPRGPFQGDTEAPRVAARACPVLQKRPKCSLPGRERPVAPKGRGRATFRNDPGWLVEATGYRPAHQASGHAVPFSVAAALGGHDSMQRTRVDILHPKRPERAAPWLGQKREAVKTLLSVCISVQAGDSMQHRERESCPSLLLSLLH